MTIKWRATSAKDPVRTTVFLVRHGQTDWNVDGRYHGQADIPLNAEGRRQAAAVAPLAAGLGVDAILSSPLSRALRTAEAIAEESGLQVATDERLFEVNVGEWTGLTAEQVMAIDPGYGVARRTGADRRFSRTGETPGECATRAAEAITQLAAAHPGGRVMAVSHGFALNMATGRLLGLDIAQSHRFAGLFNCAWAELVTDGDSWRLEAWNVLSDSVPNQRGGETVTV